MSDKIPARAVLIPAQRPEQELMILNQLLGSLGFTRDPEAPPRRTSWTLIGPNEGERAVMALYPEIGVIRLHLVTPQAEGIEGALAQYLPVMVPSAIAQQLAQARSAMEKSIFTIMGLLARPDAHTAMREIGDDAMATGSEPEMQGVVQGLMFLETVEAADELQTIIRNHAGQPIAELAERGLTALAQRGITSSSPDAAVVQAKAALADDKVDEALELILPVLDLDDAPDEARVVAAKALALADRNLDIVDRVAPLAEGPFAAEVHYLRGLALEKLKRLEDAASELAAAVAADDAHEHASTALGRVKLALDAGSQSHEEQLTKLDAALAEHPADPGLRLQRGRVRLETGDALGAVEDFAAAADKGSDEPELSALRAEASLAAGHYAHALKFATQAGESDLDPARVAPLRGRTYLALDEPGRALASFKQVLVDHPGLGSAQLGQGIALELSGRKDDAEAAYHQIAGAAAALEALSPIVFDALPGLNGATGLTAATSTRPPQKAGTKALDPLFKVCLSCGSSALGRRTSCRSCGAKEWLK